MTIIQQPPALSLSLNLKEFRISTSEEISFVLKMGAEEILSQRYTPGQNNLVSINVRDIVHARLSSVITDSSLVYEQKGMAADFTAIIAGTPVTFRVVRGGVDRLADVATNFLTQNFLTWQPNIKPVTYSSPEFLTYYAVVASTPKLCAYFTDDTGRVTSQTTISLAAFEAGKAYTIPLQYAVVSGLLDSRLPAYYDVWVENNVGSRLTYIQRYYAADMRSEQEQWILFENSLGGVDTFRAYGTTDFTAEHTHNVAEVDEVSSEYRVDTERKFQKNTGYLDAKERQWLLDFFPSGAKYICSGSSLRPIVVTESNVTYNERELPSNYTFTYKYADARPLLNLPRTDQPDEVLNIIVPSVGSFTVPPRLVEFSRLPLTEGALFPVQSPYSEKWSATSVGSVADFVAQYIANHYGGEGGIGHTHGNIDLLNLLSAVDQYLLIAGKKIKAAYSDESGLAHTLKTETFTPGIVTGIGALIDKDGRGELESLILRRFLEVPELRYSRTKVVVGDKWRAPGGGLIESVDTETQTVTLKLQEKEIGAVEVDDICMGIFHSVNPEDNAAEDMDDSFGNRTYAGFFTAYFTITEVIGTDKKQFKYQLRPESERWKHSFHPTEAMSFVSYGNFTDEDRQTSVYETRTYTRMLRKQNTWEIGIANIAFQYGEMGNMNVHGVDMTGYSMYLSNIYLTGSINQIKPDGTPVKTANDRGKWKEGHYDYYDRVSYNGSLWLCVNENGTDSSPTDGNASWLKQVGKGEPGVPGTPGADGKTTYTWIRYADDANGGGIANNPLDKKYIGFAYNKPTATESNDPADYTWSRYRGEDGTDGVPGTPGTDGKTFYTWITYSDYSDGRNMYQVPTDNTNYIGIAVNKETASESNNPADYTWSRFKGADGAGVTPMGHWQSANVPYRAGDLVSFGNAQYLAKRNTSRPPIALLKAGESYLTTNYGYIPLGTFEECGNPDDWELLVKDGKDGSDGKQGIPGCITRKAEWTLGVEWRNDESLEGGTRYLDIALVRDNSLQTGWQAYKCLKTHVSNTGNAPGNTQYWEPFGLNVNAIFTSLIIAKDAHLDFVQGNRINIKKDDGTVTAGMSGSQSGDKTRIWAGGADPDNAPFRVNEGGHATIYDADIAGQFSAAGGKIILYRDGSGRLANGKIYWDADGNIYIQGVYQTKTSGKRIEINPSTNSFRMYNENNQLVMSMVFEDMAGMGVSMPKIRMYDYNASNQLLKSATYSSSSMSIVDYINATGRTLGVTLSPFVGLSFDENGLETKRYARK